MMVQPNPGQGMGRGPQLNFGHVGVVPGWSFLRGGGFLPAYPSADRQTRLKTLPFLVVKCN